MNTNENKKLFGVVKTTRLERGFFFISYNGGDVSIDVFAHISQIMPGFPPPKANDRVMFRVNTDSRSGRMMAVEVETYPPVTQAGV